MGNKCALLNVHLPSSTMGRTVFHGLLLGKAEINKPVRDLAYHPPDLQATSITRLGPRPQNTFVHFISTYSTLTLRPCSRPASIRQRFSTFPAFRLHWFSMRRRRLVSIHLDVSRLYKHNDGREAFCNEHECDDRIHLP